MLGEDVDGWGGGNRSKKRWAVNQFFVFPRLKSNGWNDLRMKGEAAKKMARKGREKAHEQRDHTIGWNDQKKKRMENGCVRIGWAFGINGQINIRLLCSALFNRTPHSPKQPVSLKATKLTSKMIGKNYSGN